MQKILGIIALVAFIFVGGNAVAADEDAAKPSFIYGTYFYCDTLGEDAADEAFTRRFKPTYEKALKDGKISGWGYLKHHTGGKWRRLTYHMGGSATDVIKAGDAMGEMMEKDWTDADDDFAKACRAHDDYIWRNIAGNVTEKRGKIGMSVYFKCDMSQESRADEIVKNVFAPIYNAHLGEGMLTSWGWLSHVVGGGYRRAVTMTAANIDDLMTTRAKILGMDIPEGEEFVKICGSHQDYIWDISMEGR